MNVGRFLGLLTVVLIVLGVLMLSPIGDMINARLLEAQAKQAQAQAQMLEAQNERLQLLPLVFASLKDSLLVVVFIAFNQAVMLAVIVYLVRELRREHAKRDVSVSGLR